MFKSLGFREALADRQRKLGSCVCVGLDPLVENLPPSILEEYDGDLEEALIRWMIDIIDATAPFASVFKPQSAHYESMDAEGDVDGRVVLWAMIEHIHKNYPDIPIILDCKRGDIKRTQERYAIAHLVVDNVDAMNFNPYMGSDTLSALAKHATKGEGLICLVYTSNSAARETQDVILQDGRRYWEFISERSLSWAVEFGVQENFGQVMAAAYFDENGEPYFEHLKTGRIIVGEKAFWLIPGVGTQEGLVLQTVQYGFVGWGTIAINSSSKINFASNGTDYAEAAGKEAEILHLETKEAIESLMLAA